MTVHQPTVDECRGCDWQHQGYCIPYLEPAAKWRNKDKGINCPMATHIVREQEKKHKLNPIKAAKRAAKLRKEEL